MTQRYHIWTEGHVPVADERLLDVSIGLAKPY
jgi:hypothetical protein